MPVIRVELLAGRTIEQKRAFAKSVTDSAAEILECGRDAIQVIFDDVEVSDWAIGGQLLADKSSSSP